jgi:N,N-dimethylformamidase beta subunit-like, C-terminal
LQNGCDNGSYRLRQLEQFGLLADPRYRDVRNLFCQVGTHRHRGASHVFFVVRHNSSHSDVLFQTSDTTWQAYNDYGGNSLYVGQPAGRAYKVSYNPRFGALAAPMPESGISSTPSIQWCGGWKPMAMT